MIEIHPSLFIGTTKEAAYVDYDKWRFVNVAKTMHMKLLGWTKPIPSHPYYIMFEPEKGLSVNWVDGPASYYDYQGKGVERTKYILEYIHKNLQDYNVLIVCDQAESRSPSVALLYLAKYLHRIPNESYEQAKHAFLHLYPNYKPGGIADFLKKHWDEI